MEGRKGKGWHAKPRPRRMTRPGQETKTGVRWAVQGSRGATGTGTGTGGVGSRESGHE